MENRVTLLLQPLPGLRLIEGGTTEEGSIVALRKDGDECLYVSGGEEDKGMVWIPVGEFSVDPEAVTPPDFFEEPQPGGEAPAEGGEEQPVSEKPSRSGPMGRLRRRPEIGGGGGQ